MVGQTTAEVVLAAGRPPSPAFRGPVVVGTLVPPKVVRNIPVAGVPLGLAVPHVRGRPVAILGRLRLPSTTPNRPALTVATSVVARTYEVAVGRSPLVPASVVTAGLAVRIVVARVTA